MKLTKTTKLDFNTFLKIHEIFYEVREVDSADIDDNFGRMRWRRNIVKLNKELNFSSRFHTLIHEIIHAIIYHGGLEEYLYIKEFKDKEIEFMTKALETGLSSVLLSNKEKFVNWLMADKNGIITNQLK